MQLFSIVPLFLKEGLHMSERLIGGLMTLNGLIIVLFEMAMVYSIEEKKWRKTTLITAGVLLAAVAYLAFGLWGVSIFSAVQVALLYVLFVTLSEMLVMPFVQSFTVERSSPATRGQYLALYSMGGALAQTMAPAFGSFMVATVGFSVHWLAVAGICLVSAGGFWWVGNQVESPVRLAKDIP